jgi:glucose-6-phosphate-specific signal transduction histidine kinase
MTRKQLNRRIIWISVFYLAALLVGIFLNKEACERYTKLIPLIVAMPAAYLVYCFQRRSSYMQSLRQLWSNLVKAINHSTQYTYNTNPTVKE